MKATEQGRENRSLASLALIGAHECKRRAGIPVPPQNVELVCGGYSSGPVQLGPCRAGIFALITG